MYFFSKGKSLELMGLTLKKKTLIYIYIVSVSLTSERVYMYWNKRRVLKCAFAYFSHHDVTLCS